MFICNDCGAPCEPKMHERCQECWNKYTKKMDEHIEAASKLVASWPEWKRNILGKQAPTGTGEAIVNCLEPPVYCCHGSFPWEQSTGDCTSFYCLVCRRGFTARTREEALKGWNKMGTTDWNPVYAYSKSGQDSDKSGQLREWWVVASLVDEATVDLAWRFENKSGVHVREVPSPERVREALDEYAENKLCLNWDSHEQMYPSNSEYVLQLLRSLGIDTEGL